jgi:hypothetical protein
MACGGAVAQAAPDPLSDADGDGLPYQWEVAPPVAPGPAKPVTPKRCGPKQRLSKGKCVKKCKRGRTLKRGKCVKRCKQGRVLKRAKCVKRKAKAKRKRAKARAAATIPANVASLGADPNHKDIFVQIDYANAGIRANLSCQQLDAIVAAFANAPVGNPDGQTGIDLHIDAGVVCPSRSYALGGSRILAVGPCPGASEMMNAISTLPESRAGTFHVAGFTPTACGGGGEGGAADLNGTKMVVYSDGPSFAHVLMHELGHNLGLDHPFPGQPNRLSTMNTHLFASSTGNSHDTTEVLDFQRFDLPELNENALSEAAGISAPPQAHDLYVLHHCPGPPPVWVSAWPGDGAKDWNCNTPPFGTPVIDPGTVSADVNGDGQLSVFPATGNEWATLDYASGGGIGLR